MSKKEEKKLSKIDIKKADKKPSSVARTQTKKAGKISENKIAKTKTGAPQKTEKKNEKKSERKSPEKKSLKRENSEIENFFNADFSLLTPENLALNTSVLFSKKTELAAEKKVGKSIIISSRVRLARNLTGEKFLKATDESEKLQIFWKCVNAISKTKNFKKGVLYRMDELSEDEKNSLAEDRIISKELAQLGAGTGVYVSKTRDFGVMVNEEDHLRIHASSQKNSLGQLWNLVNALDDEIEEHIPYCFDEKLGYLTSCPTNLGTGMRASVMMHLPALVMTENMEKVVRGLGQLGATVRGFLGEGSEPCGSFFQLSNQVTLGKSEEEIVAKIETLAKKVCEFEINARRKLMRENPLMLADKIERAHALLSSCKLISSSEALSALSNLMLAADIGCMNGEDSVKAMNFLIKFVQPFSLAKNLKTQIPSLDLRDALRAKFLNEVFSKKI